MHSFLLADDHSIVRSGIRGLIQSNFVAERIDEAGNGEEVIDSMKLHFYDIIMLDINLPDTEFSGIMHWISAKSPGTYILVFTMHSEDVYGIKSISLGASGFLRKNASGDNIVRAIQTVLNGKVYVSESLRSKLDDTQKGRKTNSPFDKLSARELGICILLNHGKTLPEIARIFNIEYSTVNTHKRRIFEKLNVNHPFMLFSLMQTYHISDELL